MLHLELDRQATTPLLEQVVRQVRDAIDDGTLAPGDRLPSSRRLADRSGLSRNTVVGAYERLLAEGWLEAGVGRGTFVVERPPEAPFGGAATATGLPFSWQGRLVRSTVSAVARGAIPDDIIDLAGAVPGAFSFPAAEFRRALEATLDRHGAEALGYGPPAGWRPLRAFIAERAHRFGLHLDASDVLVVGGSQSGLDLIARLLLHPGDTVITESPTYANALELFRQHGVRVLGAPMDGGGLRPEPLAALLRRERPKLVYLMPSFQNPTGLTLDTARRRAVLAVLRDAQVPVIEDHFDAELRFVGEHEPPLKAFDEAGQVLLLGTFSKILCPGLRLGWIVAPPPVRRRLLELKRVTDLASSLPLQMAVAELGANGDFDRHLDRVRAAHAVHLEATFEAFDRHLPPAVRWTRPMGGMNIWLTLPSGLSAMDVYEAGLSAGVAVAPGRWFEPDPHAAGGEHLRLSFVGEPVPRLVEGIRRLADVLHRRLRERPRRAVVEEAPLFV